MLNQKTLPLSAGGAVLIGTFFAFQSLSSSSNTIHHIQTKRIDYDKLVQLQDDFSDHRAAANAFEKLDRGTPQELAELIQQTRPGMAAQIRPRKDTPLPLGWNLQRVDVTFDDVQLAYVGQFIKVAEETSPPWKVTESHIIASQKEPGRGRALLVMEALQKIE